MKPRVHSALQPDPLCPLPSTRALSQSSPGVHLDLLLSTIITLGSLSSHISHLSNCCIYHDISRPHAYIICSCYRTRPFPCFVLARRKYCYIALSHLSLFVVVVSIHSTPAPTPSPAPPPPASPFFFRPRRCLFVPILLALFCVCRTSAPVLSSRSRLSPHLHRRNSPLYYIRTVGIDPTIEVALIDRLSLRVCSSQ